MDRRLPALFLGVVLHTTACADRSAAPPSDVDSSPPIQGDAQAPLDRRLDDDVLAPPDQPDAANLCRRSPEARPFVQVIFASGALEDCNRLPADASVNQPFVRSLVGVVREDGRDPTRRNILTIDTCGVDGCAAQNVVIDVTRSIPFALPAGAFVEVEYWFGGKFACQLLLRISNLATWNGRKNPVADGNDTYLIVSSGVDLPNAFMAVTGITAELFPADCVVVDAGNSGCAPRLLRNYAYRFSHPSAESVTVTMADEKSWSVNGRALVVRNHQAFLTGDCDNWFDWGFTIASR